MFDTDGNQRVDKHEFLVVRNVVQIALAARRWNSMTKTQDRALIVNVLIRFSPILDSLLLFMF